MKKMLLVLAVAIILIVPVGVYAATSDVSVAESIKGFCGLGVDVSNLTEQQKEDLDESFYKMVEIRKESIDKMIQNGLMTKKQGGLALERLGEMVEYHKENDSGYCIGMMGEYGHGRGMMGGKGFGRGMKDGK
ncbi:MAG: DUF2680 domain-containing protein [Alkaliphilus sp.]|nr:DUF2680 domain-containing protein [Alkaliphilus sp.]